MLSYMGELPPFLPLCRLRMYHLSLLVLRDVLHRFAYALTFVGLHTVYHSVRLQQQHSRHTLGFV